MVCCTWCVVRGCCACVGMCMLSCAPSLQGVWARQPASTESTDLPIQKILCSSRLAAPPLRSAVLVVLVALLWRSLEVGLTATTPLAPSTGWRSERAAAPQRCFGSRRDWQAPGLTCLQHTVLGAVSQVHGSTDGAAGLCTSGRRTSRGPPGKCESRWSREM